MKKLPKKSARPKQSSPKRGEPDASVLGVRLEREVKERLALLAKEQRRSLSAQAVLFIESGVKHHEEMQAAAQGEDVSLSGVKHRKPAR